MTAIEFFDQSPIDNSISALTTQPDKVIFLGDGKAMRGFELVYREFLRQRELEIQAEFRSVNRNDVPSLVQAITRILEEEEDCVFDLTGGDELVLLAMGIVASRCQGKKDLQLQRFNVRGRAVQDIDRDGRVLYDGEPELTVEENILLHGGVITQPEENTFPWDLNGEFVEDIGTLWELCRKDPGKWNMQMNLLQVIDEDLPEDELEVQTDKGELMIRLAQIDREYVDATDLLKELYRRGIITHYGDTGRLLTFRYKDRQIRRLLAKAGTVLEMKVLVTALQARNKDGEPVYSDAMNGVYIHWDGLEEESEKPTVNEIDVALMQGMIPLFVSCKNGRVEDEELYKLDVVTSRFGGKYARRVLIATYLGKTAGSADYLRQRAEDMNIKLITGVHELSDEEFAKMISRLMYNN